MSRAKVEFVRRILGDRRCRASAAPAVAFAPANVALGKYWGKRDTALNLPVTGSLSVSLGPLGTHTRLSIAERTTVWLNGEQQDAASPMARRVEDFLALLAPGLAFSVVTRNTVPTAAGLASSASGAAALVLALDALFGWSLDRRRLSLLARLGSGSACRSVAAGFVEWLAGERDDGTDSFARRLDVRWPDLRVGIVRVCEQVKAVGSREGMRRTVATSALYRAWPEQCRRDLATLKEALRAQDFAQLGATAEANAMAMHATMLAGRPALIYWQPGTLAVIHRVRALRDAGVPVYLTIDAGPNVKLLFPAAAEVAVADAFSDLATQVVAPFAASAPAPTAALADAADRDVST